MKKIFSLKCFLFYGIMTLSSYNCLSQVAIRFENWENIESFDITDEEDYVVFSRLENGRELLFESSKVASSWTEPKAIEPINNFNSEPANIGGPFLSMDEKKLYFHANFSNSTGGYDIYYSQRNSEGWGEPINIGEPINSITHQMFPSVTPGNERIYFSEGFTLEYEYKKSKLSPECQRIKTALKSPNDKWKEPYYVHQVINTGCEFSPVIAPDGKTLYYSSIDPENHKDGYKVCYTSERGKEVWTLPNYMEFHEDFDGEKVNPRITKENLYFLRWHKEKKVIFKHIYKKPILKEATPFKTITSNGRIVTKIGQKPIEANITIYNPTTLKVLARYSSDKYSGEYELCLLDKKKYLIEIRKHGYSFANYMVNYKSETKQHIPETIALFDTIELNLSVFDSEIFSPLTVNASAYNSENEEIKITGHKIDSGVYKFKLPLGSNYQIQAYADWFDRNEFLFKLEGDIVFNQFNRNLPLTPQKDILSIVTTDAETGVEFVASGHLVNLNSDEPPRLLSMDEDGKVKIDLRKGDKYELTMNPEGYFFHSQVIDLQSTAQDSTFDIEKIAESEFSLAIKMDSLRKDKAITLDNITFPNNSAALSSVSFTELDKVVDVIIKNADLFIEISAHTDNIGSKSYNNILSNRRAQSVVNYLLEKAVPIERLISKGYGYSSPKVPNDSDENRAINRRVEFKVISKDEMVEASNE